MMITTTVPESIKEVQVFGKGTYDFVSQCLTIEYSIGGDIYSHTFTAEETSSWADDDDMVNLLCTQKGFAVNNT